MYFIANEVLQQPDFESAGDYREIQNNPIAESLLPPKGYDDGGDNGQYQEFDEEMDEEQRFGYYSPYANEYDVECREDNFRGESVCTGERRWLRK